MSVEALVNLLFCFLLSPFAAAAAAAAEGLRQLVESASIQSANTKNSLA